MNLNSFESLSVWFRGNSRKGAPAPYWTLYSMNYGDKDKIAAFNDKDDNVDSALEWLIDNIRRGNNPLGQRFRVVQTDVPRGNNPVGTTNVQIFTADGSAPPAAGIGSPGQFSPVAVGIGKEEVAAMIEAEREKWNLEQRIKDLEAQLNAPPEVDLVEKYSAVVEKIAQTPLGMALVSKITGVPVTALMGVHGNPAQDEEPTTEDHDFYNNLGEAAQILGTNEHQLAKKINQLVKMNPDVAKQLFQQ